MQQEEQQEWLTLLNGKIFDIPYADLAGISLPCDSLDLEFVDLQLGQMEQAPSTDVMDQKYALQFRCAITIQNNPRTFDVNHFTFLNKKKEQSFRFSFGFELDLDNIIANHDWIAWQRSGQLGDHNMGQFVLFNLSNSIRHSQQCSMVAYKMGAKTEILPSNGLRIERVTHAMLM